MDSSLQRVERHVIKQSNPCWHSIDEEALKSKELYNVANYQVRQSFCKGKGYIPYLKMHKLLKSSPFYQALPAKVAQQTLRMLDKNWQGFFVANKDYKSNPNKYKARPKIPGYLKRDGRYPLVYTIQALGRKELKKGLIKPSRLNISIHTLIPVDNVSQVRIIPKCDHYVLEVVYLKENNQPKGEQNLNPTYALSLDIGLNNLLALTSNKPGFIPALIKGGRVKSTNQYYNKKNASLTSRLEKDKVYQERVKRAKEEKLTKPSSKRLDRLNTKRYHKIQHLLHSTSRQVINMMEKEGLGTLVIGYNPSWKQEVKLGKRNNQNFVHIPFARLIEMLKYKAEEVGIEVIIQEESYTSKCSFLDKEAVCKHEGDKYLGRRIKRGLFKTSTGTLINADVNGSYNILQKAIPNAFPEGIETIVVWPRCFRVNIGGKPSSTSPKPSEPSRLAIKRLRFRKLLNSEWYRISQILYIIIKMNSSLR